MQPVQEALIRLKSLQPGQQRKGHAVGNLKEKCRIREDAADQTTFCTSGLRCGPELQRGAVPNRQLGDISCLPTRNDGGLVFPPTAWSFTVA